MKHPKTTIAGYLVLGASVLSFAARLLGGGGVDASALQDLFAALSGLGLVSAGDGGH